MNLLLKSPGTLTTSSGTQYFSGGINTNGYLMTVNGAGDTNIQGPGKISGSGGLSKQGTGDLTLAATNSYTGNTTIGSGTLTVESDGALGGPSTSTTVDSGATLVLSGNINYVTPEKLFVNGDGFSGAGALESFGGATVNTFAGPIVQQSESTINAFVTPLTLTGTIDNGGFPLTVTGTFDTNVQGVMSGAGGLTKQGSGTLTLSAANSYSGNTAVAAGMLTVTHDAALGAANTTTTVDAGAVLALSGGFSYITAEALYLNGQGMGKSPALLNLSGVNSFAGPVTLQSDGRINTLANSLTLQGIVNINGAFVLTVTGTGNTSLKGMVSGAGGLEKDGIGTLSLAASNSYAGNSTVVVGTVVASADAALGAANTKTTVDSGATLALSGGINYSTTENLILNGTGFGGAGALRNLLGNNTFAGLITLQHDSTLNTAADSLTLKGTIDTGGFTLTFVGPGNSSIPAVISGSGSLSMQSGGTLTLSATNSYTNINITSGTVYVEADGALGGGAVVSTGAILSFAGLNYTLPTGLILNGGVVDSVNVLGSVDTFAGPVQQIASSTIAATPGTTFTFSGQMYTGISPLTLNVAGPGTLFFNGLITGAGGLNLLPATLTLSANNSYTGPTTVNGNLIVNGVQPSSAVTVNAGGILAGTGSVGAVVAKSGGTVEPGPLGSGIGTLIAASADFSQGGTLLIRAPNKGTPGVNYDQFDVTGTLTLGGSSSLAIDVNGLPARGKLFGIVLYGSVSGNFSTIQLINNGLGLKVNPKYRSTQLDVDLT
jgi:autotransporter-associated beta strand protein